MIEQLSAACAELLIELTILADRHWGGAIALHDRRRCGPCGKTQRPEFGILAARGFDCWNACFDCGLAVAADCDRSL